MSATNPNIGRDEYQVNPGFINEGLLRLGDGLDMSDPGAPKRRAGKCPFVIPKMRMAEEEESEFTVDEHFELKEASSTREEARFLSTYLQGSYGFVSASAALERATEERSNSHSIYALQDSKGKTHDIGEILGGGSLIWDPEIRPQGEDGEIAPDSFERQFLMDYGSHYVSAIKYGCRLAIRGRVIGSSEAQTTEVRAAFRATFLSGSAAGGIDANSKKALTDSSVELTFVATSGGFRRNGEPYTGAAVLTRLEDIVETLQLLRSGELRMLGAPISATARSYWNLLPLEFARSRALLAQSEAPPLPEGLYGVPAGTIIAWHPTERQIHVDESDGRYLIPPEGWAICNGEEGTPDLRDRFLMGTVDLALVGVRAGQDKHTHGASCGGPSATGTSRYGAWPAGEFHYATNKHGHGITVAETAVLPPHVKLVYLMKR